MIVSRLERDNNKEMFEVEATFGEFLFFLSFCVGGDLPFVILLFLPCHS